MIYLKLESHVNQLSASLLDRRCRRVDIYHWGVSGRSDVRSPSVVREGGMRVKKGNGYNRVNFYYEIKIIVMAEKYKTAKT